MGVAEAVDVVPAITALSSSARLAARAPVALGAALGVVLPPARAAATHALAALPIVAFNDIGPSAGCRGRSINTDSTEDSCSKHDARILGQRSGFCQRDLVNVRNVDKRVDSYPGGRVPASKQV